MDIQMPILDGLSATRRIRAWEMKENVSLKKAEKVPIYALTAHALKEEVQNSLEAGCNGHITKPIKKNDIISIINKHAA